MVLRGIVEGVCYTWRISGCERRWRSETGHRSRPPGSWAPPAPTPRLPRGTGPALAAPGRRGRERSGTCMCVCVCVREMDRE